MTEDKKLYPNFSTKKKKIRYFLSWIDYPNALKLTKWL